MESLPYGPIIDTLKCLDFNQLFSLRQTNKYFKTLIGRYEHLLAKKEFHRIYILVVSEERKGYKNIDLESGVFNFTLNKNVEEKWHSAIDKKIPVYLNTGNFPLDSKEICIVLDFEEDNELILKLPIYPINIEELKIVYCWLFHLSCCGYKTAFFTEFIFNPEFLQLLFDKEENIQFKFHTKSAYLNYYNLNSKNVLKFIMKHLIVAVHLVSCFNNIDNTEEYSNILLTLVLNGGEIIGTIIILFVKDQILYNLIVKNLEKSKDCSKMVARILIEFKDCPFFNLSIRAEDVKKKQDGDRNYVIYELSNIYNPTVKYSIVNIEENGKMLNTEIKRIS
ncbi:hypothetical protein ACQ4LE_005818 [Meloidogyne hapla]|uniref:F-box domain-containing protein n=1 Tax=Meloidogyne hapla TaxID=6305 RepID=A0A1I8BDR1_MELHA